MKVKEESGKVDLKLNIQKTKIMAFGPITSWQISQESSPTSQFKSIKSLALSFLCGPTLTFIHDYWKHDSFDFSSVQSLSCV